MILLWLLACVHVPAFARSELLSRPMVEPTSPCEAVVDAHLWSTAESMSGATVGGGVACGCN
jgi:hypothetical protein